MLRVQMWRPIVLAALFWILEQLISYHVLGGAFDAVSDFQEDHRRTSGHPMENTKEAKIKETDDFYTSLLRTEVVVILVLAILKSYWNVWLERLLPARPRSSTAVSSRSSEKVDGQEDDAREEEIIRKWVKAGRVRRASLSWCNTFLKWTVELTIGRLWQKAMQVLLRAVIEQESLAAFHGGGLVSTYLFPIARRRTGLIFK